MFRKFISFINYFKIYLMRVFILKKKLDLKKKFTLIFKFNYWLSADSKSGTGSTIESTANTRKNLDSIIKKYNIQKILDVPCGDFFWMRDFLKGQNIIYQGGDVVEELVLELKKNHENDNKFFSNIDITKDRLPSSDLLLCRDCFIHFSNEDIIKTLINFSKSDINYFLVTHTINDTLKKNEDIYTGEYRFIDLFSEPFNLDKKTLTSFQDDPMNRQINNQKQMSLWTKSQIIKSLNKY
jgi:hypothetical protein